LYGGHGIVGAPVPLGTGWPSPQIKGGNDPRQSHLSRRWRQQSGQVYESFNMEKLWHLPVTSDREQPIRMGLRSPARRRPPISVCGAGCPRFFFCPRRAGTTAGMLRTPSRRAGEKGGEMLKCAARAMGDQSSRCINSSRYRAIQWRDSAKYRPRRSRQVRTEPRSIEQGGLARALGQIMGRPRKNRIEETTRGTRHRQEDRSRHPRREPDPARALSPTCAIMRTRLRTPCHPSLDARPSPTDGEGQTLPNG